MILSATRSRAGSSRTGRRSPPTRVVGQAAGVVEQLPDGHRRPRRAAGPGAAAPIVSSRPSLPVVHEVQRDRAAERLRDARDPHVVGRARRAARLHVGRAGAQDGRAAPRSRSRSRRAGRPRLRPALELALEARARPRAPAKTGDAAVMTRAAASSAAGARFGSCGRVSRTSGRKSTTCRPILRCLLDISATTSSQTRRVSQPRPPPDPRPPPGLPPPPTPPRHPAGPSPRRREHRRGGVNRPVRALHRARRLRPRLRRARDAALRMMERNMDARLLTTEQWRELPPPRG